MEDRVREVVTHSAWDSPADIVKSAANSYQKICGPRSLIGRKCGLRRRPCSALSKASALYCACLTSPTSATLRRRFCTRRGALPRLSRPRSDSGRLPTRRHPRQSSAGVTSCAPAKRSIIALATKNACSSFRWRGGAALDRKAISLAQSDLRAPPMTDAQALRHQLRNAGYCPIPLCGKEPPIFERAEGRALAGARS